MWSRFTLILITVLICAAVFWRFQAQSQTSKKSRPIPSVISHTVAVNPVNNIIEALGTTRANESVDISVSVTEKVSAVRFEDGQEVSQGQVLLELESKEQEAQLKIAEIQLHEQLREYKRIEDLVKNKSVSRLELDRIQSLIDTAKARIDEVKATISDRIIRAPFNGVLGFRNTSVGTLVQPGSVITTLDDIAKLKVDFDVSALYLSKLSTGKEVIAHSQALPDKSFIGKIDAIDSRVDPATRSITVRAIINNPQKLLRPGMLLTIEVINERRRAHMIPEQALLMQSSQVFVYQLESMDAQPHTTVKLTPVSTGIRQNGMVEITKGLKTGERILLHGHLKVKNGTKVKVEEEAWRERKTQETRSQQEEKLK